MRVLQDELQFPDDKAMDQDTKSLLRGVCNNFVLFRTIRMLMMGWLFV